jgi:hypothetical protein
VNTQLQHLLLESLPDQSNKPSLSAGFVLAPAAAAAAVPDCCKHWLELGPGPTCLPLHLLILGELSLSEICPSLHLQDLLLGCLLMHLLD